MVSSGYGSRMTATPKSLLATFCIVTVWLMQGCGTAPPNGLDAASAVASSAAPTVAFERADDPSSSLARPGPHCFETATAADTARRRAADAVAVENAAQQRRLEVTGEPMETGRPFEVTDIRPSSGDGSCYRVITRMLQEKLGEIPPGCCL